MIAGPHECDVLVIGAGIAGVAIAERLAREAAARSKRVRVCVADEADQIGAGASRGLQGWFHSGALYARLKQEESFRQCVASREILRKRYSAAQRAPWFSDPIEFYIDNDPDPAWAPRASKIARHAQQTADADSMREQGLPLAGYTHAPSGDRVMRTTRILSDLAQRAAEYGVDFLLAHRARQRESGRFTLSSAHETFELRPRLTVWTAGCLTPDTLSLGLKRRSGVILTMSPALELPNMVCVARDDGQNISHIAHHGSSDSAHSYSALGNSAWLPERPTRAQCEEAAMALLARARDLFGDDAIRGRRVGWHTSTKIEARSADGGEPLFGPVVRRIAEDTLAVIPSKFSLFPLTAERALDEIVSSGFFDVFEDGALPALSFSSSLVAPTLSEQVLGLSGSRELRSHRSGAVMSENCART